MRFLSDIPDRTVSIIRDQPHQLVINASNVKKIIDDRDGKQKIASEIWFWGVDKKHITSQENGDLWVSDAGTLPKPIRATYDPSGNFLIDYKDDLFETIIVKEFETFSNTAPGDFSTMRLIYSYIIPVKRQ